MITTTKLAGLENCHKFNVNFVKWKKILTVGLKVQLTYFFIFENNVGLIKLFILYFKFANKNQNTSQQGSYEALISIIY